MIIREEQRDQIGRPVRRAARGTRRKGPRGPEVADPGRPSDARGGWPALCAHDLQAIFGSRGYAARCRCQRFKTPGRDWDLDSVPGEERAFLLRGQTDCGSPGSDTTSGLVAYMDGEPVGWCAVESRDAYVGLGRVPWTGRTEDKTDDSVWAVTCFVTRAGFRRRGITYPLARAAVDFAQKRGARAIEGYPMITEPGQEVTWGFLHVGSRKVFAAAGFEEISRPTKRRVVMRIDF